MNAKIKAKIKWVIGIFILIFLYKLAAVGFYIYNEAPFGPLLSRNVIAAFGKNLRIYIAVIDDKVPRLVLFDENPADQEEYRKTNTGSIDRIIDHNIYAYELEDGFFFTYNDDVLYIYGSAGFLVIYAEPFQIKLIKNESLIGEKKEKINMELNKYNDDEMTRLSSIDQLNNREKKAYERLKIKAEKRIEELKSANEYP